MKLAFSIFILILSNYLTAQTSKLKIAISANQLNAKDTLMMEANYTTKEGLPKNGTLYLKIINNVGTIWKYRWPINKGFCYPQLAITNDLPQGKYNLFFATRDEQFGINGTLDKKSEAKSLLAITNNVETLIVTTDIEVNDKGKFYFTCPYFSNQASVKFTNKENKYDRIQVKLESVLDSAFTVTASAIVQINVGAIKNTTNTDDFPERYEDVESYAPPVIIGNTVIVKGKKKSPLQLFTDKYISSSFKDFGESTLDLLDADPTKFGSTALNYLTSNIGNLTMVRDELNEEIISWRGVPVSLYFDEVLVQNSFIQSLDLNDIAVIKVFRPPFFQNISNEGGAVAFFSKRFGFGQSRASFIIKGYSPIISTLYATPTNFWQ